jgi:DNA mismatch repair protein MutS
MHQITQYDEINKMKNIKCCHLEVYYDREKDALVYDRKIKSGSGNRMYGLEVCKSLYMPTDFLENALVIRNRYFPDMAGDLQFQLSQYNSNKIKGICELCKKQMSEEVHHLQPQKNADKNGYIGGIHKNHAANLFAVCKNCHDKMHVELDNNSEKVIIKKKKTTKGYIILSSNPSK